MGGSNVIGVDLGGTNLRVALVKDHEIVQYIKKKTPKTEKKLLEELTDSIKSLNSSNVMGIGVASPGPLVNGFIKNPPNLPIKNFDLKNYLKKKFRKKVEVANDADCVALAESKLGYGRDNFIVLTLGTGIGGGLIINNDLYLGRGHGAEPGHIIIQDNHSFEDLWQKSIKKVRRHFGKKILIKDLLDKRDKFSKDLLKSLVLCLGKGVGSVINVVDPEVVVLNGGIKETGEPFLNMIRKEVKKYVIFEEVPEIHWSKLEHPGVLGASLLIK